MDMLAENGISMDFHDSYYKRKKEELQFFFQRKSGEKTRWFLKAQRQRMPVFGSSRKDRKITKPYKTIMNGQKNDKNYKKHT